MEVNNKRLYFMVYAAILLDKWIFDGERRSKLKRIAREEECN